MSNIRYLFGFLAAVGLIVLVFILLLRSFTSHGPKNAINLMDYADSGTVVRLTVDGPVTANDQHQAYRITVGRDANTIEVIQGYQNNVVNAKTYANNKDAYTVFLRTLQLQGFTKGDPSPAKADERGICPTGTRSIFEIISAGNTVQRYWSASCTGGSFKGNVKTIQPLFIRQIPDFTQQTRGVHIG